DAAQIIVTDAACTGNTTLTSATANFNTTVVGNLLVLVAGSTYQGHWEVVAYVNPTTVTLDRNGPNASGMTMRLGGASKMDQSGLTFYPNSVSGSKVWIKGPGSLSGDYGLTINAMSLTKTNSKDAPYTIEGYQNT